MSGIPNVSTKIVPQRKVLKETGSCFDTTTSYEAMPRAGSHKISTEEVNCEAFSHKKKTSKPRTSEFLQKGEGSGGKSEKEKINIRESKSKHSELVSSPSHQSEAYKLRPNPPNTAFRKFYERGDMPVQIGHGTVRNQIAWKVDISKLDFHHYLPIFFDGLRETEEPYAFLAEQGIKDMMINANTKVLPVIPQLIIPIKTALNTRAKDVIVKVLQILQLMVTCDASNSQDGGLIGQALVPYYRQILPVLNIFIRKNDNLGDGIDYSQQRQGNLGDLIQQTLETFELHGGDDAFINIKYLVPTYQSVTVN